MTSGSWETILTCLIHRFSASGTTIQTDQFQPRTCRCYFILVGWLRLFAFAVCYSPPPACTSEEYFNPALQLRMLELSILNASDQSLESVNSWLSGYYPSIWAFAWLFANSSIVSSGICSCCAYFRIPQLSAGILESHGSYLLSPFAQSFVLPTVFASRSGPAPAKS